MERETDGFEKVHWLVLERLVVDTIKIILAKCDL